MPGQGNILCALVQKSRRGNAGISIHLSSLMMWLRAPAGRCLVWLFAMLMAVPFGTIGELGQFYRWTSAPYIDTFNTILSVLSPTAAHAALDCDIDNDDDAGGNPLTARLVNVPFNGTLKLNSDGSFGYTPDVNFNSSDPHLNTVVQM